MNISKVIEKRIIDEAIYYIKHNSTFRKTAEYFNISKSTVHIDLSKKLKNIDSILYLQFKNKCDVNLKERHLRGGQATRLMYMNKH